jgi:membrane-associated phospholipid phosphatase
VNARAEPFLAWPGWKHIWRSVLVFVVGAVWFLLIYGGCDAVTGHRTLRVRIHTDAELKIPFVPETVVIYMSIYLLFVAVPFILRSWDELLALAWMLNVTILISGVCYLVLPAQLAFEPHQGAGMFPGVFRFADRLNLTYNLMPSLHVGLSAGCLAVFAGRSGRSGKVVAWLWGVAIGLSTLLTHQHHVLDVVTGFLLALLMFRVVYLRQLERKAKKAPASSARETESTAEVAN